MNKLPELLPTSLVGQKVGNWILEDKLGEGGMSEVHRGRHVWLAQYGAVKLLRPELCRNQKQLERFQQEAHTVGQLHHENIIEIRDFGHEPNIGYFMVLELLEGYDLEEVMPSAPFSKNWLVNVTQQICSGLEAIHSAGVIHRDLKPSNIFLLPKGLGHLVKILDFGIAKYAEGEGSDNKLTKTGAVLGTPFYIAPEQLTSKRKIDSRVDVYALGVILYQLLTGKLPIERPTMIEQMMALMQRDAPKAGMIRPALQGTLLEAFLARMLEKDPDDRYANMLEVWQAFDHAISAFEDPLLSLSLEHSCHYPAPTGEILGIEDRLSTTSGDVVEKVPTIGSVAEKELNPFVSEGESGSLSLLGEKRPSWDADEVASTVIAKSPIFEHSSSAETDKLSRFDDSKEGSSKSTKKKWNLIAIGTLLVGLSTFAIAAVILFLAFRPPTATEELLDRLIEEGRSAFQKGHYKEAAESWKKVIGIPAWKKSEHFPAVFYLLGETYQKRNRIKPALSYYEKYRDAEPRTKKIIEKLVRETIPTLKNELVARQERAKFALRGFKQRAKEKNWKAAYAVYKKLGHDAPSLFKVHEKMAEQLSEPFPSIALRVYRKLIVELEPTNPERQRIALKISALQLSVSSKKERIKKLYQEVYSSMKRKNWAKMTSLFEQIPVSGMLFPQGHELLQDGLRSILPENPEQVSSFLKRYMKKRIALEKTGSNKWLPKKMKRVPSVREIKQQLKVLQALDNTAVAFQKARTFLRKGAFASAISVFGQIEKHEAGIQKRDRWFFYKAYTSVFQGSKNWGVKLNQARMLLKGITAAYKSMNYSKVLQSQKNIDSLLRGSGAEHLFTRVFRKRAKSVYRIRQMESSANRWYRQKKWSKAYSVFEKLIRKYPRSARIKQLKFRYKVCGCGLGVPWLKCKALKSKFFRTNQEQH